MQYLKFTEAAKVRGYERGALIAGVIADVTAAAALCCYLRKFRTGFKRKVISNWPSLTCSFDTVSICAGPI
jgi:hypothetical protein